MRFNKMRRTLKPSVGELSDGRWRVDSVWRGLVGAWFFLEGGGQVAHDYSGQGHHGTLTGMASPPSPTSGWNVGQFGHALAYDGINDYVSIPDTPILNPAQITIAASLVPTDVTSNTVLLKPKSTHTSPFYQYGFRFGSGATLSFNYSVGSTLAAATTTATYSAGQRLHIVGTYDGVTGKIYVNGILQATSTAVSGNLNIYATALNIGRSANVGEYATGKMDGVLLYNRALMDSEVKQLYVNFFPDVRRRVYFVPTTGITTKIFTESVGLSKALIHQPTQIYTESIGLAESSLAKLIQAFLESLGLTESRALLASMVRSESTGLSESHVRISTEIFAESVGLAESSLAKLIQAFLESFGVTESQMLLASMVRLESVGLSESQVRQPTQIYEESIGLAESSLAKLIQAFLESLGLTESRALLASMVRSESVGLSEANVRMPTEIFAESVGLAESFTKALLVIQAFLESLDLIESETRMVVVTHDEAMLLQESFTKTVTQILLEHLGLSEAATFGQVIVTAILIPVFVELLAQRFFDTLIESESFLDISTESAKMVEVNIDNG